MTFCRTPSGLSNFYLFVGADAIVFLEGGKSIGGEDVANGKFTELSSDIRFWQTLFEIYRPDKKYQFRSVGSKEIVKSIAYDIAAGKVTNVIVAMDRDFDHINERIISSYNVLYTKGYSWENDAWSKTTILEAYCTLSGACKSNVEKEVEIIERVMDVFSSRMWGAIRIDAILSQYKSSVFDREKPVRYVHIGKNGYPSINMDQVKNSLAGARIKIGKPIFRKSELYINAFLDCFGHLFAEYAYRLLGYLLEKFRGLPKMPKEYATGMVVEKFGKAIAGGILPELKQHYDAEFLRAMP